MLLKHENNRIYSVDTEGHVLAEITFPKVAENVVNINHTFVDESLRGRGIADSLMKAAVSQIHEQNKHAVASCSYARQWFEDHPEYNDILRR